MTCFLHKESVHFLIVTLTVFVVAFGMGTPSVEAFFCGDETDT